MGEKEQSPHSLKQRPGPCSVCPSPEGVRETQEQSETHEKTAQSPSCCLKDDWDNTIWLIQTVPLQQWIRRKVDRGFSEHRESCPSVEKKINRLPAPTPHSY